MSGDVLQHTIVCVELVWIHAFGLHYQPGLGTASTVSSRVVTVGREMSKEYATGCNIFKDGEDPKLRPDEEYPDWLWDLIHPLMTVKQIHQKVEQIGYDDLPYHEYKRLQKLERKERIKAANRASQKK